MMYVLAGNQNCGKTTLFNALTGSNQHVGNFPGVTVEQKAGVIRGTSDTVVDLPGIYSLRPYSGEEMVARDFIIKENPDGIINIVDAANIERNLYLTLQLLEMGRPMIIALNMMDEVRNNGGAIDFRKMSEDLGVPVVPISAVKAEGIGELTEKINWIAKKQIYPHSRDFCPPGPMHRCIQTVSHLVESHARSAGISTRFCVSKLMEGDETITDMLKLDANKLERIERSIAEMESECGLDRNAALADIRYGFIENVCKRCVVKGEESKEHRRSVAVDRILTDRYLALPIFFSTMALIFYLTFGVIGQPLSGLLSTAIDAITAFADKSLTALEINPVVHSLVIDGIFAGVGSVLRFLPPIVVLFFFLSILEDTGYMTRVAFVMDRLFRKIGLSGQSIVPLIIGFGCSVPAVMASRTLSSDRDRKMTILLIPFMSCSAKIPIYAIFSAAFFPKNSALVMTVIYIGGIAVGILAALLLKNTLFKGSSVPFVMELPNYRIPSLKNVLLLMWEKARDFTERAFTVIFIASIVIWFLQTFDARLNTVSDSSASLLALVGRFTAPLFEPLGFGDWRISTALIAGFSAKEAVVITLGVLLRTGIHDLGPALADVFTPAAAVSFLAFTLLYTPCVAAVAAIRREMNSAVQAFFVVLMQSTAAWLMAFAVYQVASRIL